MIFVQISSLIKAIPKIIVPKATNWSAFLLGFSFLIICLACCSCGSTKVVPIETIRDNQVHDTIVFHNVQYDSIYVLQDKYTDRSKDTLLIKETNIEYRYKLLSDTIRIVQRDSFPYEVRITEVKEVKYIPPWTKALAYIGSISILFLLIYIFTKLKGF